MKYRSRLKNSTVRALFVVLVCSLSTASLGHGGIASDPFVFDNSDEGEKPTTSNKSSAATLSGACMSGLAGGFPCKNVHLLSVMPPDAMGAGSSMLNDIWGWTDPVTGNEIAIVGRTNGTSFIDITDGTSPVFLGFLPTHGGQTGAWRDIKVYQDHAFIVADSGSSSTHGMQVLDLSELFNVPAGSTLSETAHLGGFGASHNIAINEDTGFAYVVGSDSCSGGLYMIDISTPDTPSFVGCFSADGYTHDAQCLVYRGPDTRFSEAEICVAYNEDTITIIDVSNKSNPVQLSRVSYPRLAYAHQGWFFSDAHQYLVTNDEQDEIARASNTSSYIFDVSQLDAPRYVGRYVGPTAAIDHNLYTKDNLVYETNYRAGLRVLGEIDISQACLAEVAYFDTIPNSDAANFSGTWSSYVYFASGNIIVSDIENGLFVLRPDQAGIDADVAMLSGQTQQCAEATATPQPSSSSTPPAPNLSGGGTMSFIFTLILSLFLLVTRRVYRPVI